MLSLSVLFVVTSTLLSAASGSLSSFMSDSDLAVITALPSIECAWIHVEGSTITPHTETINTSDMLALLKDHANDERAMVKPASLLVATQYNSRYPTHTASTSSARARTETLLMNMTSYIDMLCVEYMILTTRVNVLLPFSESSERAVLGVHPIASFIERKRGIPVLTPPLDVIVTFGNKELFADWMVDNGLGEYHPILYRKQSDIEYPAVVKVKQGNVGRGVFVVQTKHELKAVVERLRATDQHFIVSEAIPSKYEISPNFIAHQGRLLAMFCVINREQHPLTVIGVKDAYSALHSIIDCDDINKISPLYSVISRLVERTGYNGFGAASMKLVVKAMKSVELEAYLGGIRDLEPGSDRVIKSAFDASTKTNDATIKIFEVSPRISVGLYSEYMAEQREMISMYLQDQ